MQATDAYKTAISTLYEKTYGRFEHDEEKAIEVFDKLLEAGMQSHCDTIKHLCLASGYEEHAADDIAYIYDILSIYKQYKMRNKK